MKAVFRRLSHHRTMAFKGDLSSLYTSVPEGHMQRGDWVKWVNLLSFIALVLMVSTGLLLEFSLPKRSRTATVLGLSRYE